MSQDGVSLRRGHDALERCGVTAAPAPSTHGSSKVPLLYSQFRGPFVFNETEEERKKREEEERKKKEEEDEHKRTNFDRVREKAEREEAARKRAEEERDALRKEKEEREAAERKRKDEELAQQGKEKELREQREKELEEERRKAEAEKARADTAQKELDEFRKAQQEELDALLKEVPEADRPPLDESMTVAAKIKLLKYAKQQIESKKGKRIGGGARHDPNDKGAAKEEILHKMKEGKDTEQDALELMGTAEE